MRSFLEINKDNCQKWQKVTMLATKNFFVEEMLSEALKTGFAKIEKKNGVHLVSFYNSNCKKFRKKAESAKAELVLKLHKRKIPFSGRGNSFTIFPSKG